MAAKQNGATDICKLPTQISVCPYLSMEYRLQTMIDS